jgi:hypothetical protein
MAFDDQWFEIGTGAIEGSGMTGASRADDDNIAYVHRIELALIGIANR